MQFKCPKCRATAVMTPKGRSSWSTSMGSEVSIKCVEIQERMAAEGGRTSNLDCQALANASQAAFNKFWGK